MNKPEFSEDLDSADQFHRSRILEELIEEQRKGLDRADDATRIWDGCDVQRDQKPMYDSRAGS